MGNACACLRSQDAEAAYRDIRQVRASDSNLHQELDLDPSPNDNDRHQVRASDPDDSYRHQVRASAQTPTGYIILM